MSEKQYVLRNNNNDNGDSGCQPATTTTFAKRAYRCSAPAAWNSLPKTVVRPNSDSVTVFKSGLKTILFSRAFCPPLLSSTLPVLNVSEVMTLWRYTNAFINSLMWTVAANFWQTHSPSRLALSEGWQPPGAQSTFIKQTG